MVAVAVVLVAADFVLRTLAARELRDRARERVPGARDSSASIQSFPFFGRLLVAGSVSRVHVKVEPVGAGPIDTEIWSLDEELSYTGKLYPPQVVADGVADAIARGWVHRTVPRQYGLVGVLYPIIGRPMRWGLRRYAAQMAKKLRPGPEPS